MIWERQENEVHSQYEKFLVYLSLGPSRSLSAAWRAYSGKTTTPPGNWQRMHIEKNWAERATQYDTHLMLEQAERAAKFYISAVEKYAKKIVDKLEDTEPYGFDQITKAIELLYKLFPGETIGDIIEARQSRD